MKAKTASPETAVLTAERKLHNTWVYIKRHWQLYLLFLLPAVVLTLVFKYAPMGGVLIAFQKYNPFKGIWGSEWVGFKNFTRFMSSPDFQRYLINTLKLSVYGLLWGFPIPILLAFLLNRIESKKIKQKVQLVLYMPNFISVIVLCGIVRVLLSVTGPVNGLLHTSINFMTLPEAFRPIYIISGIWQGAGWASIMYTASLSNASKDLKEAAMIDGANLIQQIMTVEWSTYVSKGKAGRYGVCFSWDVANIDNLTDWEPLPALTADTRNITPQNGSFTSGFARGRCVVTAKAANPALVCAWLDQMYAPLQSPQNNWGTYGDAEGFNIFELSTNDKGEPMLKHAPLGDASPVEVREAQCVSGPLAVLDDYYGVYVTCPDDAQYRLDWIKEIYTPDMNNDYVYPNVFMSNEDTEQVSNLQADLQTYMNTQKANWIMNGTTDAEWNEYLSKLEAYGLSDYLGIMQKYLDAYYA